MTLEQLNIPIGVEIKDLVKVRVVYIQDSEISFISEYKTLNTLTPLANTYSRYDDGLSLGEKIRMINAEIEKEKLKNKTL